MKKIIFTLALGLLTAVGANAQDENCVQNQKGDWYVGTGDIANTAWTDWSLSPTIGYGVSDDLMVGASLSQVDSTSDMDINFHARYFWKGYFGYVATSGLSTDNLSIGAGKMFTLRNNIFVDPKLVYNTGEGTTNLTLGFGFRF
jgi:hypothetical protein